MHQPPRRPTVLALLALLVGLHLAVAGPILIGPPHPVLARPAGDPLPPADQAVLDEVARLLGDPGAGPAPADDAGAGRTVVLIGVDADGRPVARCVGTLEEARAFLAGEDQPFAAVLAPDADDHAAPPAVPQPLAQLQAGAGAEITIVNLDGPGEGFNDPTPAAPVGGNPGTTVGQQRLRAFEYAAAIWASRIQSTVSIRINAQFDQLSCSRTSGALGAAGPLQSFAFPPVAAPPGAQPSTLYPVALANKLAGRDLSPAQNDIVATFNSEVGKPGCLESVGWYYGFDGNEGPFGIDLVTTLLHEFAHGLGFISLVSPSTGQNTSLADDIWNYGLFDRVFGRLWKDMAPDERRLSAAGANRLVWSGPATRAAGPYLLGGAPALSVEAPAELAGVVPVGVASFGPRLPLSLLRAQVALASPADACAPLANSAVAGAILLADLGGCAPEVKARNAQAAGAAALLLADTANNGAPPPIDGPGPDVYIPVAGTTLAQAQRLRPAAEAGTLRAALGIGLAELRGADDQGRPLMYTPAQVREQSSVSHFDQSATPNLLMEPFISAELGQDLDLTDELLRDIGWYPDTNHNLVDDRAERELAVSQTVSPLGRLPAGASVTLSVTVRNAGALDVASARLVDSFPARLGDISWTAAYSGGASGPGGGAGDIGSVLRLPAGSSAVFTIQTTLLPGGGPDAVVNVARLLLAADEDDRVAENNAAAVSIPTSSERLMLPMLGG